MGWGGGPRGMLGMMEARFTEMDANGDGFIDAAELQTIAGERAQLWTKRFLARFDENKDGKVSRDEFDRFAKERFTSLDVNGDGKISEEDLPPLMRGTGILKQ